MTTEQRIHELADRELAIAVYLASDPKIPRHIYEELQDHAQHLCSLAGDIERALDVETDLESALYYERMGEDPGDESLQGE